MTPEQRINLEQTLREREKELNKLYETFSKEAERLTESIETIKQELARTETGNENS